MKSKAFHTKRFARLFLFTALILALVATPALAAASHQPWFEQSIALATASAAGGVDAIGSGASTRVFVAETSLSRIQIYGYEAAAGADGVLNFENKATSDAAWFGAGDSFNGPRGVAVADGGGGIKNLYVADTGNQRILKFTETGASTDLFSMTAQAGTKGATGSDCVTGATPSILFNNPYDVAVDTENSRVYVADTLNHRVVVLDLNLALVGCWMNTGVSGNDSTHLNTPRSLAYSTATDSLIVTDTLNHRLVEIDVTAGTQLEAYGAYYDTIGAARFNTPSGVAVDDMGFAYVADTGHDGMHKVDFSVSPAVNGRTWTTYIYNSSSDTTNYTDPLAVAALTENRIFVADTGADRVQAYEKEVYPTEITLENVVTHEVSNTNLDTIETGFWGKTIGIFGATDGNVVNNFTYTLESRTGCDATDNGAFRIAKSPEGVSSLNVYHNLDRESKVAPGSPDPAVYHICVKVYDGASSTYGGRGDYWQPFTITVEDQPDAPVIIFNVSPSTNTTSLDEYTADALWTIPGDNLGTGVDYYHSAYNFTISAYDNDVSSPTSSDITLAIPAGAGGTLENAFTLTQDTVRAGVNANITVKNCTGQPVCDAYKTLLDYEHYTQALPPVPAQGTLTVTATDASSNTTSLTITVNLTGQNDPPVINVTGASYESAENIKTVVPFGAPILVTDVDTAGSLLLDVNPTNTYFQVTPITGETNQWNMATRITTNGVDYETNQAGIDVRLRARDAASGGAISYQNVHITILDVNDPPKLLTSYQLHDTTPVETVLNLTQPPDAGDTHTYTITGGNDEGYFKVVSGQIRLAKPVSVGQTFVLGITVLDSRTDPATPAPVAGNVTITVIAGNRPPVFVTSPAPVLTIPENTTSGTIEVGRISASDPDGNDITITTDTTDPNNPFTITTTTEAPWQGIVYVDPAKAALLNYEDTARFPNHKYTLTATVSDGEFDVDGDFQVSITNINEAISITNKDLTITRGDRTPVGTVIGTIQWDDVDGKPATTPTFALSGDGANQFGINSSGQIYILPTASLHYYLDFSYTPTITITDKVGGDATTDTDTVPITLTDDNDPPTFIAKNLSIAENSANGSSVGSFQVFDENGQDFSVVVNDPASAFNIAAGSSFQTTSPTGVLYTTRNYNVTVKDTTKLNYEIPNHTLPLVLSGTEAGVATPLSRDYTYNIALTNVNEPPSISNQSLMTYQNVPGLTVIGKLTASDPDAGTVFTFLPIAGGTGDALFEILSNGDVRVKSVAKPQEGTYTLFSKVRDNITPPLTSAAQATITITVTKLADPALESVTLPAAELLTGTTTQYKVTVKNKDVGKSSPYSVNLKLPGNMNFVTGGSSAGCKYITADTVGCPAPAALNPMGTSGDTASFVINAAILADMPNGATRTATASLALDDPLNDNVATNNSKTVTFTARRAIVLTNQTFETGVPVALTKNGTPITTVTQTPTCATTPRKFLGLFSNDEVKYLKQNLINHNYVEVSFDLYLAYSWEGLNNTYGPDRWKFTLDNRAATVDTTFSNISALDSNKLPVYPQSFPDTFASGLRNPAFTGASQVGTLGYYTKVNCGGEKQDSVYSFRFIFDHTDPQVLLDFIAQGLTKDARDWQPEQWGLDNLKVTISGVKTFNVFLPSLTRP